ncbi:MAG: M14 family zinc carboxypeptidase, partial [Myxococcota bacterium]|nr:M14 family zinc carboxypeptidase [Myxococcota bacterium]
MRLVITRLVVLVFLPAIMAAAAPPVAAKTAGQGGGAEWVTVAEESGFEATPSYDETLAWLDRLAESSPAVDLQEFGHSGQGRPLPLVVVSTEQAFEPELARATGKPLVLLQCGIHSGEISGKDATLILLRELLIEGRHPEILDHLILLVVPIYNVDGHERMGQSRINQDGPIRGMGFRTTARGQDLNRDYMKLDSEEARALVGSVVARWDPHLLMDLHTTDGADHRIEVSYSVSQGPLADEGVGAWSTALAQRVAERMEAAGRPVAPYVFGIDRKAPQDGF